MCGIRVSVRSTINWAELRAAAIVIGVREAGRQAAADLPEPERNRFVERVMKRSQREGWIKQTQLLTAQTTQSKPLSANVRTGSDALATVLEERKSKTKLHLSKYVEEASYEASNHGAKLKITGEAKDLASVASQLWPEKEQQGSGVMGGLRVYSQQTVLNVQTQGYTEPQTP